MEPSPKGGKRGRKKGRISTCKGSGEPQEAWCATCRGVSRKRCVGPKVLVHTPTQAIVPVTRNALQNRGLSIAESALEGQFVVVEVTGASEFEPWMIGEVVEEGHSATEALSFEDNYMGYVEPGDFVIKLRKWDPVLPGGRNFQRSDKVFLAFGEDLRRTLEEAEFVQRDGRRSVRLRGRSPLLRELTEKAHQQILELIV